MKYMVRAVSRDLNGKVTDIADTWPLNATTVEDAKAEVDRQHWREPGDVAKTQIQGKYLYLHHMN